MPYKYFSRFVPFKYYVESYKTWFKIFYLLKLITTLVIGKAKLNRRVSISCPRRTKLLISQAIIKTWSSPTLLLKGWAKGAVSVSPGSLLEKQTIVRCHPTHVDPASAS